MSLLQLFITSERNSHALLVFLSHLSFSSPMPK